VEVLDGPIGISEGEVVRSANRNAIALQFISEIRDASHLGHKP
jgi:hypothetical protein